MMVNRLLERSRRLAGQMHCLWGTVGRTQLSAGGCCRYINYIYLLPPIHCQPLGRRCLHAAWRRAPHRQHEEGQCPRKNPLHAAA